MNNLGYSTSLSTNIYRKKLAIKLAINRYFSQNSIFSNFTTNPNEILKKEKEKDQYQKAKRETIDSRRNYKVNKKLEEEKKQKAIEEDTFIKNIEKDISNFQTVELKRKYIEKIIQETKDMSDNIEVYVYRTLFSLYLDWGETYGLDKLLDKLSKEKPNLSDIIKEFYWKLGDEKESAYYYEKWWFIEEAKRIREKERKSHYDEWCRYLNIYEFGHDYEHFLYDAIKYFKSSGMSSEEINRMAWDTAKGAHMKKYGYSNIDDIDIKHIEIFISYLPNISDSLKKEIYNWLGQVCFDSWVTMTTKTWSYSNDRNNAEDYWSKSYEYFHKADNYDGMKKILKYTKDFFLNVLIKYDPRAKSYIYSWFFTRMRMVFSRFQNIDWLKFIYFADAYMRIDWTKRDPYLLVSQGLLNDYWVAGLDEWNDFYLKALGYAYEKLWNIKAASEIYKKVENHTYTSEWFVEEKDSQIKKYKDRILDKNKGDKVKDYVNKLSESNDSNFDSLLKIVAEKSLNK